MATWSIEDGGVNQPVVDEQTRLGLAARAYYAAYLARHPSHANEFDVQMLALFDAIASHQSDIDSRIEQVHNQWRHANFFQRFLDRAKLDLVYSAMARHLARHERQALPLGPLRTNWTCLLRIGNKHWGNKETMAKRWVDPLATAITFSEL